MDSIPDFNSLNDQELKDIIKQLVSEENELSYKRRIVHGRIDVLRAELVNRLRGSQDAGDLIISGADIDDQDGPAGVREPRRPKPQLDSGGQALPAPDVADDGPNDPPAPAS